MNISIKLQNEVHIPISETRQRRIQAELKKVKYDDLDSVNAAHAEIMYMGPLDSLMDRLDGGAKQDALKAVADLILCERASSWQRECESIGKPCQLVDPVNEDSRQRAQAAFIELVSPQALQGMARAWEDIGGGIRFKPATSSAEVNEQLDVVMPYERAATLFEKAGLPREEALAWEANANLPQDEVRQPGGPTRSRAASMLRAAPAWEAAGDLARAAETWGQAGQPRKAALAWQSHAAVLDAAGAHDEAKVAMAEAAEYWMNAEDIHNPDGRHKRLEEVLPKQASAWAQAGRHDREAMAWERYAALLTEAGRFEESNDVLGMVAAAWWKDASVCKDMAARKDVPVRKAAESSKRLERAARSWEQYGLNLERASQYDDAAEAWKKAAKLRSWAANGQVYNFENRQAALQNWASHVAARTAAGWPELAIAGSTGEAMAYYVAEQFQPAAEAWGKEATILEAASRTREAADARRMEAMCCERIGQLNRAAVAWERSAAAYEAIGENGMEKAALVYLADLRSFIGEMDRA